MKDIANIEVARFLSFCIEEYAKAKFIASVKVVDLFEKYGVMEYLSEFYDVLHTQGARWIIADIDEYINKRRVV